MHPNVICTFQGSDECCTYGELFFRDTRTVVPRVLRDKMVKLAHESHHGIVKIKYRLRNKVVSQVCRGKM